LARGGYVSAETERYDLAPDAQRGDRVDRGYALHGSASDRVRVHQLRGRRDPAWQEGRPAGRASSRSSENNRRTPGFLKEVERPMHPCGARLHP
jgi:hypothetical protein